MDVTGLRGRTIGVALAGSLLTTCGAPSPTSPSGISPTSLLSLRRAGQPPSGIYPLSTAGSSSGYKASKHLLYVALSDERPPYDQVNVYDAQQNDPPVLAAITDGVSVPADACIDGEGTLYVTNEGTSAGWVSVYALGSSAPSREITDGIDGPAFCAIDNRGNLWVTNLFAPDVVEYEKGSSVPRATITEGINYPTGIAFDHLGTMYVANRGSPTNVEVYRKGSTSPGRTITDGVLWPIGIAVDAEATLYVTNLTPGNIEEYRVGRSHPYREITNEMNGPTAITLAKNGWAYISNTGVISESGPAPVILEFSPGSLKPSSKEISSGLDQPLGTAYYPPLLP